MNLYSAVALLVLFSLPNTLLAQIQGQDPAIPLIAAIMQRWSSDGDFSGAVLVARDGKILYENVFGYANREWSIANDLGHRLLTGNLPKMRLYGPQRIEMPYCTVNETAAERCRTPLLAVTLRL
jgi:hypothetical protein